MNVEERIEHDRRADIQTVMSTENGRRLMWRVLSHCGLFHDVVPEEGSGSMAHFLGKRSVALFLTSILTDVDEEAYFRMMREAKNYDIEITFVANQAENPSSLDVDIDVGTEIEFPEFLS